KKNMFRLEIRVFSALLLLSAAAWGQNGRATILGAVTDPANAVVGGAHIAITHVATNTVHSVVTNDSGFYTAPDLAVGAYQISAEMQGFKRVVRTGIVLEVGDRAEVDFHLEVGTVVESVV